MLKWAQPTRCRQATKDGRYWVCKSMDGGDMNQRWSAHREDLDEPLLTSWSRTRWEAKQACEKDAQEVSTRKTITLAELKRLSFCNSKKLPSLIEMNGNRLQWVGFGWVNEGDAQGDEVLVVDQD